MRSFMPVFALLMICCSALSLKASADEAESYTLKITTDQELYQMVCDPARVARFALHLTGTARCSFIASDIWIYTADHAQPCDYSLPGQVLQAFLGKRCSSVKALNVPPEKYKRTLICDESAQAQVLLGAIGKASCIEKFSVLN